MHEKNLSNCPRCKKDFTCNATNLANCSCNFVVLTEKTRAYLAQTSYKNCLCSDCLIAVNEWVTAAQEYPFPNLKSQFIEGIHYYKENGNWVFTEIYHLLRGSCCGNGCRHCVYKFN